MSQNRPKSTALRILEGNPSGRPLPKNEPKPKNPMSMSLAQTTLFKGLLRDPQAKRFYKRYGLKLNKMGISKDIDEPMFILACYYFGLICENVDYLEDGSLSTGKKGTKYQHPAVHNLNGMVKHFNNIMSKFGGDPSDRTRIAVMQEEGLDEMLDGGGLRLLKMKKDA